MKIEHRPEDRGIRGSEYQVAERRPPSTVNRQLSTVFRMVFTDLDRTLLRDDRTVSERDYSGLIELGKHDIIRVIATGRSPYSLRKVVPENFPIDYIIFSSGAGIYNWRSQKILRQHHLSTRQFTTAIEILLEHNANFMVHAPIPDNHRFYFHGDGHNNSDFHQRIGLYREHALPLLLPVTISKVCQIIAIFPEDGYGEYLKIMDRMTGVNIIRTTSPLDHRSHWMEIVPEEVSKASAAAWLAELLNIPRGNTLGIGNDYNDEDLLDWTETSYVVANAPDELRERFNSVSSNQENGFTEAVEATL